MFRQKLVLSVSALGFALMTGLLVATPGRAVSDYVTYAFYDDSEALRPVVVSQAIMVAMENKGYIKVPPTQAKLLVGYWAGVSAELSVDVATLDFTVDEALIDDLGVTLPVGSLVIGIVDRTSEELIWVSSASAVFDREPTQEEVNEIAARVLADFHSPR